MFKLFEISRNIKKIISTFESNILSLYEDEASISYRITFFPNDTIVHPNKRFLTLLRLMGADLESEYHASLIIEETDIYYKVIVESLDEDDFKREEGKDFIISKSNMDFSEAEKYFEYILNKFYLILIGTKQDISNFIIKLEEKLNYNCKIKFTYEDTGRKFTRNNTQQLRFYSETPIDIFTHYFEIIKEGNKIRVQPNLIHYGVKIKYDYLNAYFRNNNWDLSELTEYVNESNILIDNTYKEYM